MPKKGQIVINPRTSRPVKVGSRTWLKLVKEGIFEGAYDDPNELYEVADETPEQVENKRRELNQTLPRGKHAVKGRGKHKGKLVVRNKRLTPMDMAEYTSKKAVKVMSRISSNETNSMDELENLTDAEIEAKLQELLASEMMRGQPARRKPKQRVPEPEPEQYHIEEEEEWEDEADEGEEEVEYDDW